MSARRRRPSGAGLRPFWFVGTALLVVAAVAGYFIASWPGFRPKHVRVTGNHVVSTAEILARAHIVRSRNIWLQSGRAMAARIERIPYILSADVHRIPPASVVIVVTERRPFAVVQGEDASALVDSELRVLEPAPAQSGTLPILDVRPAVALVPGRFLHRQDLETMRVTLQLLRAQGVSVAELRDDAGDVSAVLGGGVHVLLGDQANVNAAIPLVAPILARFAVLGRSVASIDLRSPSTPVVTERHGAAKVRVSKRVRPRHRNP